MIRITFLAMVIACAALLFPSRALAAPVAEVDTSTRYLPLAGYLDVFEDTSASLTYAQVREPEQQAKFGPFEGRVGPNYGFTTSAIWVRLTIENRGDTPVERWVVVDHPPLDDVELFSPGVPMRAAGRADPRSTREIDRRSPTFRVLLAPHESRVLHLRAAGPSEVQLPMELWEPSALVVEDTRFLWWGGVGQGILLALTLYNVFLFFFVGERAHLYYAVQVSGAMAWSMCLDGSLPGVLPTRVDVLPYWVNTVSGGAMLIGFYFFAMRFLDIRAALPRVARVATVYLALLVVGLVGGVFGLVSYRALGFFMQPLSVVCLPTFVIIGIYRWRTGFTQARYVVISWLTFVGFTTASLAALNGLLPFRMGHLPLAGACAEAILLALSLADAAKQRNDHIARLNAASSRFVPFEFLALLGKRELPDVKQGDQIEKEMTIFFLDVRGFTSLVETLTPEQTMAFVNAIFAAMEAPIAQQHGVIDKFMGDGVMVLFERADDAVRAAVGCLHALVPFNEARIARAEKPVAIGVGLHTGALMLGTVGGTERLSCTVLGDSVNLASRIEGMTKAFGASILLTGTTRRALVDAGDLPMRRLGRVAAKGKAEWVALHEVLEGLAPDEGATKKATRADFEAGLDALEQDQLADARTRFAKCAAGKTKDKAVDLYMDLSAETASPPLVEGVIRFDAK